MPRVLVPLAQGCEELEAVTIVDLLRRAKIEVVTAGLDSEPVRGSRGTVLVPDTTLDDVVTTEFDMVVLPGGLPGADHLAEDPRVIQILQNHASGGKVVAAICAAPKVLARAGLLNGKQATSFPGVLADLDIPDLTMKKEAVVIDGKVVTSRGPGTAMDFALELITLLLGVKTRNEVEAALQRP